MKSMSDREKSVYSQLGFGGEGLVDVGGEGGEILGGEG